MLFNLKVRYLSLLPRYDELGQEVGACRRCFLVYIGWDCHFGRSARSIVDIVYMEELGLQRNLSKLE